MSPAYEKSLDLLIKITVVLLIAAGSYFLINYLWPLLSRLIASGIMVVLPFAIAYLIGTLLQPSVNYLEVKYRINRSWGALATILIFLGLLGWLLYLLVANMIRELIQLSQVLSAYSANFNLPQINQLLERLQRLLISLHLPGNLVEEALRNYWQALDLIKTFVSSLLAHFFVVVTSLPQYFLLLVITVVSSFFFARDYQRIKASVIELIPNRWQAPFNRMMLGLHKALYGYIKAELLLITITGLISLLGLIILGIDYAHILAIVVALTDFIPILGPGAFYLPWAVWSFFAGNMKLGIGLLVLYGIIVVVRQLLEPKIVGDSIGLHPLTTLMALYFGLSLFGVWGLVIGPAVVIGYKAFTGK